MGISLSLARFVADTGFEDIPAHVIDIQKKSLLDGIAITLGAATLGDGCREMVQLSEKLACGGKGEATVIGFDEKLPTAWAAFANASMAHALDFGDTHSSTIHSNSSTMPAALAAAEMLGGVSGKRFLTALVVGSEVACRLAGATAKVLIDRGFYMPTIYTAFAAVSAAASIMRLDAEQVLSAFSFMLCQATCSAELTNSPKTCMRSIREAFAAKAAIVACEMAKAGLTGFDEPFEGKLGFYHAYLGDIYEPDEITNGLGRDFICDRLTFKAWPSCLGTHACISGVLSLVKEHGIKPEEIEKVTMYAAKKAELLFQPRELRIAPESSISAKFSAPYTAAHAIIHGGVTLESFSSEMLYEQRVRELAAKFDFICVTEDAGTAGKPLITIKTHNRGEFSERVAHVFGSPENPLDDETFFSKLSSCMKNARRPRSEAEVRTLAGIVKTLENESSLSVLTRLL